MEYVKNWQVVLVFSFVAMIGTLARPFLFGNDSYASWACVTSGWCETLGWQNGAVLIFELMPPFMLLVKALMVLSLFFSVFACFLIVKHFFDERKAYISLIFGFGLVPAIIFEFSKFENELFALPLFFWGLYFLLVGKLKWKLVGLAFWLASLWFWLWPAYFVSHFSFFGATILEQQMFSGMLPLFFGILVLPLVFLMKKNFLRVIFAVFLLGGLFSGKLVVLLIPFVLLGLAKSIELLEERHITLKYVWVVAIIMLVGLNYAIFMQQPSSYEHQLIFDSIELHNQTNLPIKNDWSYGYWFWFHGYKAENNPSTGQETIYDKTNYIAVTSQELEHGHCIKLDSFSTNARSMNFYQCGGKRV